MKEDIRLAAAVIIAVFVLFFAACAERYPGPSIVEVGTARHNVAVGMKLLEKGKYIDAMWQFDRAIELNGEMSLAYLGRALVYIERGDLRRAGANLEAARRHARSDEDWINYHVGMMRYYLAACKGKWLDKVKAEFKKALAIDPNYKPAYYYMGLAYQRSFLFREAAIMFRHVLQINDPLIVKADREWKIMRKIEQASPESRLAKELALRRSLTRAELAGLLVREFKLPEVMAKLPRRETPAEKEVKLPPDLEEHVFRPDVEKVMRLGIKALGVDKSGLFHPDVVVSRAEFAALMEELFSKILFYSFEVLSSVTESPFADVREDNPHFRVILFCVTRGIMDLVDMSTGEFKPDDPVSGADALLGLKKLKENLTIYTR